MTTPDGIRIEVNGVPRAQPRGRHVNGRVVSTTGPAVVWRRLVKDAMVQAMAATDWQPPTEGAIEFTARVRFPTKVAALWGHWRTAIRSSDADNLAKALMDSAVDAGLIADDGLIARLVVESEWVRSTECGATVIVRPLAPRQAARIDAGEAPGWLGLAK